MEGPLSVYQLGTVWQRFGLDGLQVAEAMGSSRERLYQLL
jgi:hypothetical protein